MYEENQPQPESTDPIPLRDLRHTRSNGFMNWAFWPVLLGVFGSLFFGKVVPHFAIAISERRPMGSAFNKLFYDLNLEINAMFLGRFGESNLWILVLFGALLGIFLKIAFGDEKES